MKKKRLLAATAVGFCVWLVLLIALIVAEHGQEGTGIHTVWDAAWYSVVTLTTAGYGDLVPVTVVGKLIGVLLMVLSVGLWAALIGAVWTVFHENLLPAWRLARIGRKPWNIFSERNEASEALALDLQKQNPEAWTVFCGEESARKSTLNLRILPVPMDCVTLLSFRAAGKGSRTVFLMNPDGWANAALAGALAPCGVTVYSRGTEAATIPGVHTFDPAVLCARQYWMAHPPEPEETLFLLCGDGRRAQALLCEGLLVCCREPYNKTEFHVFGDWADFRRMHPELDSVIFQEEPWNADRSFLERADRILFAAEDERANAEQAAALARAFPLQGAVHAATALPVDCDARFGSPAEIYTGELVMRQALDRLALTMHQTYGRLTGTSVPWDSLSPFVKDSNRAAADHLLTKLRLLLPEENIREANRDACVRAAARYRALTPEERENCQRNEHARWYLFHALHNWRFAPVRDNERRLHPCMVPYDALSEADKAKDDSAWEIIGAIAESDL